MSPDTPRASLPASSQLRRAALVGVLSLLVLWGLLVGGFSIASAGPDSPAGAWGAAAGADPCGTEILLERRLAQDPSLRGELEAFERIAREAARRRLLPKALPPGPHPLSTCPTYILPVAVHIVHLGGLDNIPDNQVLSQIQATNRDLRNLPGKGPPATDTCIQLCLAKITHTLAPEADWVFGSAASEAALKAIEYLPSDRYLNIWVVRSIKDLAGGTSGVVGHATLPGMGPPTLDGIVMAHFVFGSNSTSFGTFPALTLPSNSDGKVLTHEVGHYLHLFHTFHGGCSSAGDGVTDTPPEQNARTGCPASPVTSCTSAPDPIHNFMDYTDDPCRYEFTPDQTTRMHAAINTYRSLLVSAGNLILAGCPSGLNALISASPGQVCAGGTVQFATPADPAYTYAWTFSGGTPATANTQSASSQFSTPGPHTVTLTVTDGGGNFSTNTTTVYAVDCAPVTGPCTNWVWGHHCRLDFATGVPVAVTGTASVSMEAASQISDSAGQLLFYSDASTVWDRTNSLMPNGTGLLGGASSHNGALILPRPGSTTQYLLFTVSEAEAGNVANPVRVTTVDMSLNSPNGDVVTSEKNVPVALPGSPTFMLEAQTLVPHCNGTDWWYVTHQWGKGPNNKLFVTLVTSGAPSTWTSNAYPIGIPFPGVQAAGTITASRDGSTIAATQVESGGIQVYKFDRSTGVPTLLLGGPPGGRANIDIAFSPSGKIIYYCYFSGFVFEFRQWDLAMSQTRVLSTSGSERDVELGPDGKIYVAKPGHSTLGVVNFPDKFNALNANECGYNPDSIPLGPGSTNPVGTLPNTLQMCSAKQPAQFTYTVTGCLTVQFHALNCPPVAWDFGDGSIAAGQDVGHAYASPGTYVVTLTAPGGSPPQQTQTLVLQALPLSIAGPLDACTKPSNYSAVGPSGYAYQWTITGGNPVSATGNNVDVLWGTSGGTVVLTGTDPATGCSAQAIVTVQPCPPACFLDCPPDVVVDCCNDCGTCVRYPVPVTVGPCCPPVTVTCIPASGWFPIGTTPVTCTAVDSCGQTSQCTFSVIVRGHGHGEWRWARAAGGQGSDSGQAVAVDGSGSVYVTGSFVRSMTFPGGPTLTGFGGSASDIFLAKYAPSGAIQWAVRAGGTGQDAGFGVAVDAAGSAYVTGAFTGVATFESLSGTFGTLAASGGSDVFVAKCNSNGVWQWATRDGGVGDDLGAGIAVTADGTGAFVTGNWQNQAFVRRVSGVTGALGGPTPLMTSATIPTTPNQNAQGRAIAVDASGNVYATGIYDGGTTLGAASLPAPSFGGFGQIFIAKLAMPSAAVLWIQHSGHAAPGTSASCSHDPRGIAVDTSGNCYVTAYFNGTANFGMNQLVTNTKNGACPVQLYDYLIVKLSATGMPLWAVKGGGDPASDDETRGIAVDFEGNPCVTGFLLPNSQNPFTNDAPIVLVRSYSPAGVLRWSRNAVDGVGFPNRPRDQGLGIAVDGAGCVHVTGAFSEDLEFLPVATLTAPAPDPRNMFVAKMCQTCR